MCKFFTSLNKITRNTTAPGVDRFGMWIISEQNSVG